MLYYDVTDVTEYVMVTESGIDLSMHPAHNAVHTIVVRGRCDCKLACVYICVCVCVKVCGCVYWCVCGCWHSDYL